MNMSEFNKVKNMTYLEYCDYLQAKYGIGKCNYMSSNYNKNPNVTRTNEGLIAHHKMEDHVIMLSTKEFAMMCPIEWQYKENIVYCDYLEHLLLHVLICKYPSPDRVVEDVGIGGVINFIAPELNDWYSGLKPTQPWRRNCYNKVIQDKEVYLEILRLFVEIKETDPSFRIKCLFKSFNESYGLWSNEKNSSLYKEIQQRIEDPTIQIDNSTYPSEKENEKRVTTIEKIVYVPQKDSFFKKLCTMIGAILLTGVLIIILIVFISYFVALSGVKEREKRQAETQKILNTLEEQKKR